MGAQKRKNRHFKYVGPNAEILAQITGDPELRFRTRDGYYVAADERLLIRIATSETEHFEPIEQTNGAEKTGQ